MRRCSFRDFQSVQLGDLHRRDTKEILFMVANNNDADKAACWRYFKNV